jgi:hypothetical protein
MALSGEAGSPSGAWVDVIPGVGVVLTLSRGAESAPVGSSGGTAARPSARDPPPAPRDTPLDLETWTAKR